MVCDQDGSTLAQIGERRCVPISYALGLAGGAPLAAPRLDYRGAGRLSSRSPD